MAPQEVRSSSGPGPQKGVQTVDNRSLAQPAHPSTEEHDDTVEAHYACLEGWVFVGYIDEYGEEREASYRCRRCNSCEAS